MKKYLLPIAFLFPFLALHAQEVTTLSGTADPGYSVSGTELLKAKYDGPYGVVSDSKGNIYVTDENSSGIILWNNGKYYPRSGLNNGGYKDGAGTFSSLLNFPKGMAVGAGDTIFVADYGNNAIRRLNPFVSVGKSQYLTTIAGGGAAPTSGSGIGEGGYVDDMGTDARFEGPVSLAISPDKSYLLVTDQTNTLIRKVIISGNEYGKVSTFAGQLGSSKASDGVLLKATFLFPEGIVIDKNQDVYVADNGGGVRLISKGKVTTILNSSKIESPSTLVLVGDYLYIGNSCNIKRFNLKSSQLITIAGNNSFTKCGFRDSTLNASLFEGIGSMILSSDSSALIVTDRGNNRVRKVMLPVISGISPITKQEIAWKVYPNPTSDFINVQSSSQPFAEMTVRLLDISGKQILSQTAKNNPEGIQLDVQALPKGVYLLKIEAEAYSAVQKIVITK